jgi:hypothetical protein
VADALGVVAPPPPPRRPTAEDRPRSGAGRHTTQEGPWLVATRSYAVGGHEVVAGATRCLPGSPAHQSNPSSWRPMRGGDQPLIETRQCPPRRRSGSDETARRCKVLAACRGGADPHRDRMDQEQHPPRFLGMSAIQNRHTRRDGPRAARTRR